MCYRNGMQLFVKFVCKQRGTLLVMFQVSKKLKWQLFRIVFGRPVAMKNGVNRPFYRYGGHLELIRFKEYYRMPRGHEHISFVFSSAFGDIFS